MGKIDFWNPDISIRITVAALISIVAVALIAVFTVFQTYREEIKFASLVIAAAAAIYSAYYAGTALRINLHRDRQRRAYEVLDTFNDSDTITALNFIDDEIRDAEPRRLDYATIIADREKHKSVRLLLGILEDLSIAVQTGYADERVLYRSVGASTVRHYDHLKRYIDGVRAAKQSQKFYQDLEKLATSWRSQESVISKSKLIV